MKHVRSLPKKNTVVEHRLLLFWLVVALRASEAPEDWVIFTVNSDNGKLADCEEIFITECVYTPLLLITFTPQLY